MRNDANFARWHRRNARPHKQPGYAIVTLSLKQTGLAPGDISDRQMEFIAGLADRYSFGEARISHKQNIILADVEQRRLHALWRELHEHSLETPALGLLTDIICCPGGDFCALANAKSIPLAEEIQRDFADMDQLEEIGDLRLNISGCMNACGHHHVGNIGILGVDKKGEEFYQISLGGSSAREASLGKILGPAFAREEVPGVLHVLVDVYRARRGAGETFLDTYRRIGREPFRQAVYAESN